MTVFDLNRGPLAPVADEVSLDGAGITVDGEIPTELNGLLIRNGPNPRSGRFEGASMLDWWVGDGMLHGLAITNGAVSWYRNRWLGPDPRNAGQALAAPDPGAPTPKSNVNVIGFGGRIMALGEGEVPTEVDRQLDPVGPMTFDQTLQNGMTAHPKLDPKSGLLRFFRADWQPPFLQVGAIDEQHRLTDLRQVTVERPVMMHDFAITPRFDLLLHLNVVLDLDLLSGGARLPLRWDPNHQTAILAVPRDGSTPVRFEIAPCFIQHVVNAYERPDQPELLVLDAIRYSNFLRFDDETGQHLANPLGLLWRYELDTTQGTVTERQLDDRHIELARIDERFTGQPYAQLYAVEQPTDQEMRGLVRYDLETGATTAFPVEPGDQNSEPVFVPHATDRGTATGRDRVGDSDEGRGWLLCCVYRAATDTTDVVILLADNLDQPPVATVHLPRRIPAGFHGAWIPLD